EDVGFPFGCLALGDVAELERETRERHGEHAEREPCEVLLDDEEPLCGRHHHHRGPAAARWRPAAARSSRRRRLWQQRVADEPGRRRVCVLRREFVLADVTIRQLAVDLELDRNEVVAAELTGAAGGDERLHGGELPLAAERLVYGAEDLA